MCPRLLSSSIFFIKTHPTAPCLDTFITKQVPFESFLSSFFKHVYTKFPFFTFSCQSIPSLTHAEQQNFVVCQIQDDIDVEQVLKENKMSRNRQSGILQVFGPIIGSLFGTLLYRIRRFRYCDQFTQNLFRARLTSYNPWIMTLFLYGFTRHYVAL